MAVLRTIAARTIAAKGTGWLASATKAAAWLVAGALLWGAGNARAQTDAKTYLTLCRQNHVASGKDMTPTEGAYEIRGTVAGLAESAGTYNLLVRMDDGTTLTLTGSGPTTGLNVGVRVRALIRGGGASGGDLPLLAVGLEGDVALEQTAHGSRPAPQSIRTSARSRRWRGRTRRVVPLSSRSLARVRPIVPVSERETLAAYARAVRYFNRTGSEAEIEGIAAAVLNYSIKYQVDARLVMAIFAVESSFHPTAVSRTGAMGIGQLMPGTAAGLGVRNPYDPYQNIEGAVKYIREQLDRYQGKDEWTRLQLVLASYNAGPGAVQKFGGVPPYRETQAYVRNVSAWFLRFLGADR